MAVDVLSKPAPWVVTCLRQWQIPVIRVILQVRSGPRSLTILATCRPQQPDVPGLGRHADSHRPVSALQNCDRLVRVDSSDTFVAVNNRPKEDGRVFAAASNESARRLVSDDYN